MIFGRFICWFQMTQWLAYLNSVVTIHYFRIVPFLYLKYFTKYSSLTIEFGANFTPQQCKINGNHIAMIYRLKSYAVYNETLKLQYQILFYDVIKVNYLNFNNCIHSKNRGNQHQIINLSKCTILKTSKPKWVFFAMNWNEARTLKAFY